jgi:hypothetical protein
MTLARLAERQLPEASVTARESLRTEGISPAAD